MSSTLRSRMTGVSLVESSMVLAISTALVGLALPGFNQAASRRHLEGRAAELATRIHEVRATAVQLNRTVHLTFGAPGGPSCYVIHSGQRDGCSCDEEGLPVCSAESTLLGSGREGKRSTTRYSSNVSTMSFHPQFGTVTPTGTLTLRASDGLQARLIVNIMGRTRACGVVASSAVVVDC